jgi:curved DNA-binding protein CbpA
MTEHIQETNVPSLYTILGLQPDVCNKTNCNEIIHKAYVTKAKKYHPDKCDCDENMKQVFELITHAYDVLRDNVKRSDYNDKLKIQNQSAHDYDSLKANFNKYMDGTHQSNITEDDAKLLFKNKNLDLDTKHDYRRDESNTISLAESELRLQELILAREKADQSFHIPQVCNPSDMDLAKFNAMFDKMSNVSNTTLSSYKRPDAWIGSNKNFNYSTFDTLDNIYSQLNDTYDCPTASAGIVSDQSTVVDYSSLNLDEFEPVSYVNTHDEVEPNYYESMTSKIAERIKQTKEIESMTYSDYKLNDTQGYGVYDELIGYEQDNDLATLTNPTILKMLMENKPR